MKQKIINILLGVLLITVIIISFRPREPYASYYSGDIAMRSDSTIPAGFLACNGQAVSRTTYSLLFSVIGTRYGVGDGSTTFNVPDTRDRFPLGNAASGTRAPIGVTGGAMDHVHSIDPASTGTSTDGSHNHTGATGTPSSTVAATNLTGTAASTTHTHSISTDGSHTHTVDISSFNTGSQNPAYITFYLIIKT